MLTREMVLRISQAARDRPSASQATAPVSRTVCRRSTRSIATRSSCCARFRACETDEAMEAFKSNLLLSINCIASGLGATG